MSLLPALPAVHHGMTRFVQRFLRPWMRRTPGKISGSDWISTAFLSSSFNAVVACRVLHLHRAINSMRQAVERLASTHVARRLRSSSGLAPSRSMSSNGNGGAVKQQLAKNRVSAIRRAIVRSTRLVAIPAGRYVRPAGLPIMLGCAPRMRHTATASSPNAIVHSRLAGMKPGSASARSASSKPGAGARRGSCCVPWRVWARVVSWHVKWRIGRSTA